MFLSSGDRDLGVAFKIHLGSQAFHSVSFEWKQRTPLSSLATTGISWRPLSGLKGVKPPVEFRERTRDCSLGPTGKEGSHLAMTGESRGFFSRCSATCGVFLELQ